MSHRFLHITLGLVLAALIGWIAVGGGKETTEQQDPEWAGVWVEDETSALFRRNQEANLRERRRAGEMLTGADLRRGQSFAARADPTQQPLRQLILMPNGEAIARPEPPAVLGAMTGTWSATGVILHVTFEESLGEPLPEPVVFRGVRAGERLLLEDDTSGGATLRFSLLRVADDTRCVCEAGVANGPSWCVRHERGFLTSGPATCWRCVHTARRGESCPRCRVRHEREARLALMTGDRDAAQVALDRARAQDMDSPHMAFLSGQARRGPELRTWRLPAGFVDPRIQGGRLLSRAESSTTVTVRDGVTGDVLATLDHVAGEDVQDPRVSPDGRHVLWGNEQRIHVARLTEPGAPRVFDEAGVPAWSAAFSADGGLLVTSGLEGGLVFRDLATATETHRLPDAGGDLLDVGTEGQWLLTGGNGVLVHTNGTTGVESPIRNAWASSARVHARWPGLVFSTGPVNGAQVASLEHADQITHLSFLGDPGAYAGIWLADDGRRLLVSDDGGIQVFEPRAFGPAPWADTETDPRRSHVHLLASVRGQRVRGADFPVSPDGRRFASSGPDGRIHVWAADDISWLTILPTRGGAILTLGFTPDGTHVLACTEDGTVHVFNVSPASD